MFASTGHLYENGFITDFKDDDWKWFEVDEGDEDDRSDLQAATAAAAGLRRLLRSHGRQGRPGRDGGDVGHREVRRPVGRLRRRVRGRGLPNNYYLHSTTGGLFSMLPWGTDQTWVDRINFDEGGLLFRQCRPGSQLRGALPPGAGPGDAHRERAGPAVRGPDDWPRCWRPTRPRIHARRAMRRDIGWWVDKARRVHGLSARPTWPPCWAIASAGSRARTRDRQGARGGRPGHRPTASGSSRPAPPRHASASGVAAAGLGDVATRVRLPVARAVRQRLATTVRGRLGHVVRGPDAPA